MIGQRPSLRFDGQSYHNICKSKLITVKSEPHNSKFTGKAKGNKKGQKLHTGWGFRPCFCMFWIVKGALSLFAEHFFEMVGEVNLAYKLVDFRERAKAVEIALTNFARIEQQNALFCVGKHHAP